MTETSPRANRTGPFIAYYRVSTQRQGQSGLGLEAQRAAVLNYLNGDGQKLVKEYTEIESGKRDDRPELQEAIGECKRQKATLVIAKLDRLARDVHFLTGLQKSRVNFLAADNPNANKMMLQILMVFAEHERDMISERTKAGLAAAKARGVKLGQQGKTFAQQAVEQAKELKPVIRQIRRSGVKTVRGIMDELNNRGTKTSRGGCWHPHTVNVLLHRIDRTPHAR